MKSQRVKVQITPAKFAESLAAKFHSEDRDIFIGALQNQEKKEILKELEKLGCKVECDLKLGYKIVA